MSKSLPTNCDRFEPQEWRKNLCKNCFKTAEQHGETQPEVELTETSGFDLTSASEETGSEESEDDYSKDFGEYVEEQCHLARTDESYRNRTSGKRLGHPNTDGIVPVNDIVNGIS